MNDWIDPSTLTPEWREWREMECNFVRAVQQALVSTGKFEVSAQDYDASHSFRAERRVRIFMKALSGLNRGEIDAYVAIASSQFSHPMPVDFFIDMAESNFRCERVISVPASRT